MPTPRPDRSALVPGAVRHVCYELTKMVEQANRFAAAHQAAVDEELVRAYFEAALLHARNLDEFLTAPSQRFDTMHPTDFGTSWRGELANPSIRKRLNHHVTHLGWDRVADPLPSWEGVLPPIVTDLLRLFGEFVATEPNGHLFRGCLAQATADWESPQNLGRSHVGSYTTSSDVGKVYAQGSTGGTVIPQPDPPVG